MLRSGALVIFPTETVYGIGTSAFSAAALQRIYTLKGRTWRKPLALLVSSLEAAAPLVKHIPAEARRLAQTILSRTFDAGVESLRVRPARHRRT